MQKITKQGGFVLVITLMVSAALTLIVLVSLASQSLETKMSLNFQNRLRALQAAQAGLLKYQLSPKAIPFDFKLAAASVHVQALGNVIRSHATYHKASVVLESIHHQWREVNDE